VIGALLAQPVVEEATRSLLNPTSVSGVLGAAVVLLVVALVWLVRENRRLYGLLIEKFESITKASIESAQAMRGLTESLRERHDQRSR
jgi:hypothetical protein